MRTIVPKRHPVDEPRHRATSWHRGPDPDAPISFADIAAMPDPDWIGRDPNEPEPRPNLMPGLVASAATVRTVGIAYDAMATYVEALLAELAELAPFAAELKAQVAK